MGNIKKLLNLIIQNKNYLPWQQNYFCPNANKISLSVTFHGLLHAYSSYYNATVYTFPPQKGNFLKLYICTNCFCFAPGFTIFFPKERILFLNTYFSNGGGQPQLTGSKQLNMWNYKETIISTFNWEKLQCQKFTRTQQCSNTKNPIFGNKYCKTRADPVESCNQTQF